MWLVVTDILTKLLRGEAKGGGGELGGGVWFDFLEKQFLKKLQAIQSTLTCRKISLFFNIRFFFLPKVLAGQI
jgi:hypothetical protein